MLPIVVTMLWKFWAKPSMRTPVLSCCASKQSDMTVDWIMYCGPSAKLKMNSEMTKKTKPLLKEKNMMAAAMQLARQKVSPDLRVPSL